MRKDFLVMTHPLVLAGVVMALAASLLALAILSAVVLVAIPIAGLWFWGSVGWLVIQGMKDELFKKSKRPTPPPLPDTLSTGELSWLPEADPLHGWTFIPAGLEQEETVQVNQCQPEPTPVLACSVDEALAVMDGIKMKDDVEFAPVILKDKPQRKPKKKVGTSRPSKKMLLTMSDELLREIAKEIGLKGITTRMKRDTLLWRITTTLSA